MDFIKAMNDFDERNKRKMEPKHPRTLTDQDFIDMHFINYWEAMSKSVYETATEKGWHETDRTDGEFIALMHSELSEGLEALRKDNQSDKLTDFTGIEEELADVIIRIMDYSQHRGLAVGGALVAKAAFNKTRSHRHGGKRF